MYRAVLCFLLCAVTATVSAQSREARAAFDAGRSAYERGDVEEALSQLRRSLTLTPRIGTAYNLAIVEAAAGHAVEAANLADRLLAGEYGELENAQREEAGSLLASVESHCARLTVSIRGPVDSWLAINGERVAIDGAVTLRLVQGNHRVEAGAEGLRNQQSEISLVNGERRTLRFDLQRQSGRIALVAPADVEVEIVDVARGFGRVEAAVDPGTYRVGVVGAESQQIHVAIGQTRRIRLGEETVAPSRRGRRVAIALSVVALIAAGLTLGLVLRDTGPQPDPVFGVIEALSPSTLSARSPAP